ncbi:MAG TPA: serine hydrolase domain-containing protein [Lacunisphaera sp.]|nr:serine hydrolase domain-containing protein [Lacunisphaera sp.]
MKSFLLLFPFCSFWLLPGLAARPETSPPSPPEMGSAAERLGQLVQAFVERDEIVGAELLVVHDGKTVLHRAFGRKDQETGEALALDSLFALRSMTKPFTGRAAQILIDEGRLDPDAPAARYLPSFANERSGAITVRQLLTHRSGMPLAHHAPLPPGGGDLRMLADLAGERGPVHPPGERFVYSDVGSNVLGAIVAVVARQPLEEFIHERILGPLELGDTMPEAQAGTEPWRSRVVSRHSGVAGHWTRYWSAAEPPLYPFLRGSGGLVSTAKDYARFLQAVLDERPAHGDAFTPASRDAMSTGFPGVAVDYGRMWMLYRRQDAPDEFLGFGHGGSDGTLAYAFPAQRLVVCYLTQTRENGTRGRFEAALSHLFLRPDDDAFASLVQPPPAHGSSEFTGLYSRDNRVSALGAVVLLDGALVFEVPGRMLLRLQPTDDPDRWVPERMPKDSITFRRERGRVTGLALSRGGKVEEAVRFRPAATLPTTGELVALRAQAAPVGTLEKLLPLRITSVLEQNGVKHPIVALHDRGGRSLTEVDFGAAGKMRVWISGDRVWREMPGAAPQELRGVERAEQLNDSLVVQSEDWRRVYQEITVLAREQFQGRAVLRVRLAPAQGVATTKLVDEENGVVLSESGIAFIPGAGFRPVETRYADFQDVEGLALPHAQTLMVAGARMQINVTKVEPRTELESAALVPPSGKATR